MRKNPFWIAVFLGLILPWILFSFQESNMKPEKSVPVPPSTTQPTEQAEIPTLRVQLSDGTVTQMDLEDYILGVTIGEMPASFDPEALKAQAVVARTFAMHNLQNPYKHEGFSVCTDSNCCQCYCAPDTYVEQGGDPTVYRQAAEATAGQVLIYEGQIIESTYFSCSGGRTEDAQAVWGASVPYLQSVESPGEEHAEHYMDTVSFTAEQFEQLLGYDFAGMPGQWIQNVSYTPGGGVDTIQISGHSLTGTQMRKKLKLNSTAFVISAVGDRITITTKGFGHRVGMSQYGADAMAVQGKTFSEILAYYYPGTQLVSLQDI